MTFHPRRQDLPPITSGFSVILCSVFILFILYNAIALLFIFLGDRF
ncbi:hypothetical protein [Chlorogloea sp. CCALA 695]|nr:hypothetical protein [Chlorogloea sp. CCALA 695]